ncbi:AtpZ/AtpI family protein [Paracoccus pacificus]|uniref:ATP synthase protein I n=1 Tax=Paracoccus pacificus TaxID=1463598 RepID=A0ABW4R7E5_9RHOB
MANDPVSGPDEDDATRRERLRNLERRIAEARGDPSGPPRGEQHFSQANQAWRMVIELVAGLGIGFGIGFGLDYLFGTMPIFLVVFVLLGFAAGINVMLRTAKEISGGLTADADGSQAGKTSGSSPAGADETEDDDGGN